jgi:hypothetical protein
MNPVLKVLTEARLRQLSTKDNAMQVVVAEIVGSTPRHDRPRPETFERWCEKKATTALPASPAAIALFVLEHQGFGFEAVLGQLADISGAHCDAGLADPTTSYPVTAALDRISQLSPPASWPKTEKSQWLQLPYTLKTYLVKRDKDTTREIRRAQNEAAELRKKHAQTPKVENETAVQNI